MTFPVTPNLSETSLEDGVLKIGPAWIYEVRVSLQSVVKTRKLLRRLMLQYKDNPFSPYFNLIVNVDYQWEEWSLTANEKTVWSAGC